MKKNKKNRKIKKDKSTLNQKLDIIHKLYGDGSAFIYGDKIGAEFPHISTGSILINHAIGIGGIPKGRITEIFGPESSGKTTLSLHIIAEAQKKGGKVAFIDAEHALDTVYASNLGVYLPELVLSQPDYGEQALDIASKLLGSVDVIVIDSVAALVPRTEIEGEIGDATVAVQARMMSQALRVLASRISKTNTAVIFINQIRKKIGVMFGNPETTSGGGALKFYSSVRLDIRRTGSIKSGDDVIANKIKVKVVKNKLAAPFKVAETIIRFGEGIDIYTELINISVDYGIFEKSGSWIKFKTKKRERKWNSKESAREYLKNNEKLFLYLIKKITGE